MPWRGEKPVPRHAWWRGGRMTWHFHAPCPLMWQELPRPGPRHVPSLDCRPVSSGGGQLAVAFKVRLPERSIWPEAASSSDMTMYRYVTTTARVAGTYIQIDYPWHRHRDGDIVRTSCPAWCPIAEPRGRLSERAGDRSTSLPWFGKTSSGRKRIYPPVDRHGRMAKGDR